jgi:hypothetical protein
MLVKTKNKSVFIIGAQRAGTTWCWALLSKNGCVSLCNPKEPDYFSINYDLGSPWYKKQFAADGASKIHVDVSPSYLFTANAAQRIQRDFPDSEIVVVLRNPFKRALSHLIFHSEDFRVRRTKQELQEMVVENSVFVNNSLYFKQLTRYYSLFDSDKIHVLWHEDLQKNPEEFALKLQSAVGTSPVPFKKKFGLRINSSGSSILMRLGLFDFLRSLYSIIIKIPLFNTVLLKIEQKSNLRYKTLQLFRSYRDTKRFVFSDLFSDDDRILIENDLKNLRGMFPSRVDGWLSEGTD